MPGWVTLEQALKLNPDFKPGWTFDPVTGRWHHPKFGFVEQRVQLDANGMPAFDRVIVGEAPNVNAVVWGTRYEKDDADKRHPITFVGVTIQARPFADNPDGTPSDPAIVYGQPCVMGFNLQGIAGADSAIREASEEAGTGSAVIGIKSLGFHYPNPTFCVTPSELFAIEVDLDKVTGQTDRSELIYRVEYVEVSNLIRRIRKGRHDSVNYRSATANSAFLAWWFQHKYQDFFL